MDFNHRPYSDNGACNEDPTVQVVIELKQRQ